MDSQEKNLRRPRVALLYDERMCSHANPNDEDHPETPERIRAIWKKLESRGIPQRCVILGAKEAEDRYIALVHTQNHINLMRNISSKDFDSRRRNRVASRFNSIYFNEGSSEAAYLAAGSVMEVSERVAKGEFRSAVAIVRPPGHHAEPDEAMGFCLFNNVAVAANLLVNERPELGIRKILIVDWDVHHGNGTQKMFWKDPRVLFFSVHRFDFGSFYPSGDDGSHTMIGEGLGAGYNINVPWEHGQCGDADYLAVWDHVLIPVAKAFNPDMILISGGFDAAIGDPLGGCRVTPYGYSVMMKKLMEFARGRIVMALEGGYNLESLANSVLACVEVLLDGKPIVGSSKAYPFESTWRVIQAVRQELSAFWPVFNEKLSEKILTNCIKTRPLEVIAATPTSSHSASLEHYDPTLKEDASSAAQVMLTTKPLPFVLTSSAGPTATLLVSEEVVPTQEHTAEAPPTPVQLVRMEEDIDVAQTLDSPAVILPVLVPFVGPFTASGASELDASSNAAVHVEPTIPPLRGWEDNKKGAPKGLLAVAAKSLHSPGEWPILGATVNAAEACVASVGVDMSVIDHSISTFHDLTVCQAGAKTAEVDPAVEEQRQALQSQLQECEAHDQSCLGDNEARRRECISRLDAIDEEILRLEAEKGTISFDLARLDIQISQGRTSLQQLEAERDVVQAQIDELSQFLQGVPDPAQVLAEAKAALSVARADLLRLLNGYLAALDP